MVCVSRAVFGLFTLCWLVVCDLSVCAGVFALLVMFGMLVLIALCV